MELEKLFQTEYTPEALEQLKELNDNMQDKILEAIRIFEYTGTAYKNINSLGKDLYEIKPGGVRAYFMYDPHRRKIIIVGFICLKKTQKAPETYKKQCRRNIERYLQNMEK